MKYFAKTSYFTLNSIKMKVTMRGGKMKIVSMTNQNKTLCLDVFVVMLPRLSTDSEVIILGAKYARRKITAITSRKVALQLRMRSVMGFLSIRFKLSILNLI